MKNKLIAIVLAVLMISSVIPTAVFAADGGRPDGWYKAKLGEGPGSLSQNFGKEDTEDAEQYGIDDTVRVSIVLKGAPTTEKYSPDAATKSRAAENYRAKLKSDQDKVSEKISKSVLGGDTLDVVWNLTLSANLISANVEYGKIDEIKKLSEVKDVIIETYYETEDVYTDNAADPDMILAGEMTNTYTAWSDGYTGAGSSVAIIDTGIDTKHLSFDAEAFDHALSEFSDVDVITKADIEAVFDRLNVKKRNPDLSVDDVYLTSKIPFAYNYVDNDTDVTHLNDTEGEHGSHVAGIAAANRYVPDGKGGFSVALSSVLTQGQAPDAQILVMKVFGKGGGAFDSDYFAAVEDAMLLGADSANLSLGSGYPGYSVNADYQQILDNIASSGTVVTMSAGNSSYWSASTYGELMYAEDKGITTTGSPSTTVNSMSVASVDNKGVVSPVIVFAGKEISYTETTSYGADPLISLAGELEFIAIDGYGTEEDIAAIADVLPGKAFICSRGENKFFEKANVSAAYGAVATVVCNNTAGSFSMKLEGYEYTAPVIGITMSDGEFIKENAEKVTDGEGNVLYYTGTITVPQDLKVNPYGLDYYTMSAFSSWGAPGSLLIKPEITAPGGSIYSVYGENKNENDIIEAAGNDKYELMSGTSMAAPQIAGISALIAEYIRNNGLEEKTGLTKRQLSNSLLMGTARPVLEESSRNYYSVLKQGAGLVDTQAAFQTHTYIMMGEDATASYADGKVKAELGEISRDNKSFSFTFSVNNFGDDAAEYLLDADLFTQDYTQGPDYDAEGRIKLDGDGNEMTRLCMALTTKDLKADVVWTVDGEVKTTENASEYDFNGDGVFSYSDVQTVLEYVVGNISAFGNMENADADFDNDIDSYDAYLIYDMLKQAKITVPANQSSVVSVAVTLIDIDDYDINGAYVEGYVFVKEAEGADGVVSSIPVLGYYGSWSDFSMFDRSTYIEYYHGISDTTPYLSYELGEAAYDTNYFAVNYQNKGTYVYGGNPFIADSIYMPQRNAISQKNKINNVKVSFIRSAVSAEAVVTDQAGNRLFEKTYGKQRAAYYYKKDSVWKSTSKSLSIGYKPSKLKDGDVFTVTLHTAVEYYSMRGEIDWDSFSDNTKFSQQFTVDGTAPQILSAEVHYNEETQAYDAVRLTVQDNQYTAYIALTDENENIVCSIGSDNDPDAEPGIERQIIFDLTEAYEDVSAMPDNFALYVYDYACNEASYTLNLSEDVTGQADGQDGADREGKTPARAAKGETEDESLSSVSFELTADENMKNGLYTVKFDPGVYGLKSIEPYAEYFAYKCTDGIVTAAFVEPDGFAAGDAVATVELYELSDGLKTVTVITEESNAERPETVVYLFASEPPVYGKPEWIWAEDYGGASVKLTRSDGFETTLEAAVKSVTTEPTCTEAGETVYTATVKFEGKTFTDEKSVTLSAHGHNYEGAVTAPTASAQGYTTYTCSCCGDTYVDDYVPSLLPKITAQPRNWSGDWDEYPDITVTAEGEGLRYQWYYRNANETGWHKSSDKDNCYDSYPLTAARNGREVYCVVTDINGNKKTSDIATMSIAVPEGYTGPVITAQPQNWSGDWNEYPDITVTAEGEELRYQWYYSNANETKYHKSTEKDDCYDTYPLVAFRNGRDVYCVITDRYGLSVTSDAARMELYIPEGYTGPTITDQPTGGAFKKGETISVSVRAEGDGLSYKWYYLDSGSTVWHASSERDDCYDGYVMTAKRSGRQLYCVITDKYGFSVKTETVTVTMIK